MVVAESTHWDPDWLLTSTEYFRLLVRRTLDRMLDELVAEPRRVFSLECVFFVEMYWRARPGRRHLFRSLVDEGRIRFSGCGVTTPDTLLPDDEMILRDLLVGQEWLRRHGMSVEPGSLYLPDSFGHSPGLPSLLAAAGFDRIALYRIDGMYFAGADLESRARFPRPGTTAELLRREATADFVWRGPDGSEALSHWLAHGYGHGDMIAARGLTRLLQLPMCRQDRRPEHVARRIDGYIAELEPMARTPYLLLGIGGDFVAPVHRLVDLVDDWNERHYDRTGVWLVNAAIDDYFSLVAHHRDRLPVLELDPNPCWTGFYASRPDIKEACRRLGRRLIATDNDSAASQIAGDAAPGPDSGDTTERWWVAATSNHHDFVTGTATERVARGEQSRWLGEALAANPGRPVPVDTTADGTGTQSRRPGRSRGGDRLVVDVGWATAVFDAGVGGALVGLVDAGGRELLRSPSLELRSYRDSGGLWRMGHELRGGQWRLADRSTDHRAEVSVEEHPDGDGVEVTLHATLDDRPARIVVRLGTATPSLMVHTTVTPPARRTVTMAVERSGPVDRLVMHQPGGLVTRDLSRWYRPTFWPLHSFAALTSPDVDPEGFTVATTIPTAMHASRDGAVEVAVARTAVKEVAYGVVPVLAPAWRRGRAPQSAHVAFGWAGRHNSSDAPPFGLLLRRLLDRTVGPGDPDWAVCVDDPLVEVTTVKPADRGHGTIIRLRSWAGPGATRRASLTLRPDVPARIAGAWRADSRERDIEVLGVDGGSVSLEMASHLATVRITTVASMTGASTTGAPTTGASTTAGVPGGTPTTVHDLYSLS